MAKFLDSNGVAKLWDATKQHISTSISAEATTRQNADDEIKALVVKFHASINFTPNKTVVEKGVTTNITFTDSAVFDGKTLTYNLLINGANKAASYPITDTTTFTGVFKINNADPKLITDVTKTAKVNAYYPKYVGGSTKTALTSDDITGFTKQSISSSAAGIANITSNANEYIWFCVPSTMSISKVTLGGFAVPIEAPVNVTVTGKDTYKCYRSTNPLSAGTRSFVIA